MIFLNQLDKITEAIFNGQVNHYPLIELVVHSLDKTLIYFFGLIIIQACYIYYRKKDKQAVNWWYQIILNIFIIYMIMLVHLTILRYDWQWWDLSFNWQRSINEMYFVPLVDTLKLLDGESTFSYWYNFFGNVVWFMPFGLFVPYLLRKKHTFFYTLAIGLLTSIIIELCQFWLETGVTHIDDLLFNGMGVILGYVGYDIIKLIIIKWK